MRVTVNGQSLRIEATCSVLEALRQANFFATRRESANWRGPCCGMGVCQECVVRINGVERLACITPCSDELEIIVGE